MKYTPRGSEIPHFGWQALKKTIIFVGCSTSGKIAGFPIVFGKTTYNEFQIASKELANVLYAIQKKGSKGEGVKFKTLFPSQASYF